MTRALSPNIQLYQPPEGVHLILILSECFYTATDGGVIIIQQLWKQHNSLKTKLLCYNFCSKSGNYNSYNARISIARNSFL